MGGQLALVLEGPTWERLGITAETLVRVQIDGRSLLISPVSAPDPISGAEFAASVQKVMTRYEKTFRKLAE